MMTDHLPPDPEFPKDVVSELKQRWGFTPEVPAELDERILSNAEESLRKTAKPAAMSRPRSAMRWTAVVVSTLAAAMFLFSILPDAVDQAPRDGMKSTETTFLAPQPVRLANDTDGNGRVDILDAYLVARALDRGEILRPEFDANGDGTVSRDDADLIALNAVRLREDQPIVF